MPDWQAFPSAISNGINSVDRTYVDPVETIGSPLDAPATHADVENSAFAMLKGIAAGFGVPVGTGDAVVNTSRKVLNDPLATLGYPDDAAAADTGRHSAISFLKGLVAEAAA